MARTFRGASLARISPRRPSPATIVVSCASALALIVCLCGFAFSSAAVFQRAFVVNVSPAFSGAFGVRTDIDAADSTSAPTDAEAAQGEAPGSVEAGSPGASFILAPITERLAEASHDAEQKIAGQSSSASGDSGQGTSEGTSGSEGSGSVGTGEGGGAGAASGSDAPSAPAQPSGPSNEQEAYYLQQLRAAYDKTAGFYNRLAQGISDLPAQVASSRTMAEREGYWASAVALRDEIGAAEMVILDVGIPESSAHYQDFLNVDRLYYDLNSASSLFARTWMLNLGSGDEPPEVDLSPLYSNSAGSCSSFLDDFQSRYAGARP